MEDRIFVYGTLRRDAPRPAPRSVTEGWVFDAYGTVPGELYDLGSFPRAIPSDDPEARIWGEVHRVPDPAERLIELDAYEGCGPDDPGPHPFERDLVDVELDGGERVEAWIYWYRLAPVGARVTSGDWAGGGA